VQERIVSDGQRAIYSHIRSTSWNRGPKCTSRVSSSRRRTFARRLLYSCFTPRLSDALRTLWGCPAYTNRLGGGRGAHWRTELARFSTLWSERLILKCQRKSHRDNKDLF